MPERRRPLLESIGSGGLLDAVIEDARKAARRRVVDEVVGGPVRDRVDEIIRRVRGR
jgi:hypothetical protein